MAKLFDYDEAAAFLGVHSRTLANWVADGDIGYVRIGERTIRFRQSDLDAYVDARAVPAAARRRKTPVAV